MRLVKEILYEMFTEESDPIKDMGIGRKMPEDFEPKFILKKLYPGMPHPIGTIFAKRPGWSSLCALDLNDELFGNTEWRIDYFIPFIGEFFEEI